MRRVVRHVRTVLLLTLKCIQVVLRSRGTLMLFAMGLIGVMGGLVGMFLLTGRQIRPVVKSDAYKKLAFDFECALSNRSESNTSPFESSGIRCVPVTNDTLSLLKSIEATTRTSQTGQTQKAQKLLDHLSSLMMNGLPIVGMDDFVRISDFVNRYLGSSARELVMSSPVLRDQFSNLLDVRSKTIVLTPNNSLTNSFHRFLSSQSQLRDLDIQLVDARHLSPFVSDSKVWAIVQLVPPRADTVFSVNASSSWLPIFEDSGGGLVATIRMPPSSVPDTRNYEWSPLKRNLVPQQAGALLYFLSGFLSMQTDLQTFLRWNQFRARPITASQVLQRELSPEGFFPMGKDILVLAHALATANASAPALNTSTLSALLQRPPPPFRFPLFHRAFASLAYAQYTFWRVFSTVIVVSFVLLFALPAAICVAEHKSEATKGLIDVLATIPGVSEAHAVASWGLCSMIISCALFVFAGLFFSVVLQDGSVLLPCCALLLMSWGMYPIAVIFSQIVSSSDVIVLLIPLLAFVLVLPGLLYSALAFDVQRTSYFECLLCALNPVAACSVVLSYVCRYEGLGVPLTWLSRAPTSGTSMFAYILLELVAFAPLCAGALLSLRLGGAQRATRGVVMHSEATTGPLSLRMHDLSKTYRAAFAATEDRGVVLDKVSGDLHRSCVTVLLGGNGAGKTTLMRVLAGLDASYDGVVHLYDCEAEEAGWRRRIGWCPQGDALYELLSVQEHVDLFTALLPADSESVREALGGLEALGLLEHRHKLTGILSGGMKRRLSLSIAMAGNPDILLCDEATSGCDVHTRELVRRVLLTYAHDGRRSVLVSTHYLDDMEVLAQRIWFLNERYLVIDDDVSSIYLRQAGRAEVLRFSTGDPRVKSVFLEWHSGLGMPADPHTVLPSLIPPSVCSPTTDGVQMWSLESTAELASLEDLLFALEQRGLSRFSLDHAPLFSLLSRHYDRAPEPLSKPLDAMEAGGAAQDAPNPLLASVGWMSTYRLVRHMQAVLFLRWLELCSRALSYVFSQVLLPVVIVYLVAVYCSDVLYPAVRLSSLDTADGLQAVLVTSPSAQTLAFARTQVGMLGSRSISSIEPPLAQAHYNASSALRVLQCTSAPLASDVLALRRFAEEMSPYGALVADDFVQQFVETSLLLPMGARSHNQLLLYAEQLRALHVFTCGDDRLDGGDRDEAVGYRLLTSAAFCSPQPYVVLDVLCDDANGSDGSDESESAGCDGTLLRLKVHRGARADLTLVSNITADHAAPIFLKEMLPPVFDLLFAQLNASSTSTPIFDPDYTLLSYPLQFHNHVNRFFLERGFLGSFIVVLFILLLAPSATTTVTRLRSLGTKSLLHLSGAQPWLYHLCNYLFDAALVAVPMLAVYICLSVCPSPVHGFFFPRPGASCALYLAYVLAATAGNHACCLYARHPLAGPLLVLVTTVVSGGFLRLCIDRMGDSSVVSWVEAVASCTSPAFAFSSETSRLFRIYTTDHLQTRPHASVLNSSRLSALPSTRTTIAILLAQAVGYLCLCLVADYVTVQVSGWIARLRFYFSARNFTADLLRVFGPLGSEQQESHRVGIFPVLPESRAAGGESDPLLPTAAASGYYGATAWARGGTSAMSATGANLQAEGPAPLVAARNLSVGYPTQSRLSLSEVCASLHPGEHLALLGVNGGGKTTFFKMFALAEAVPCEGILTVGGLDSVMDAWALGPSGAVGYVAQESGLPSYLTVRQTLAIFCALKLDPNKPGTQGLGDIPACEDGFIGGILPQEYLDVSVSRLSGGTLKKLLVLVGNLTSPRLLLLDECTTGVDPFAADSIMRYLHQGAQRNPQQALIMTTHRIEDCVFRGLCNRVCVLVDGQIVMLSDMATFQAQTTNFFQVDVHTCVAYPVSFAMQHLMASTCALDIQRTVQYTQRYVRLTLSKRTASVYALVRILRQLRDQGVVRKFCLRIMELEEVLADLLSGSIK